MHFHVKPSNVQLSNTLYTSGGIIYRQGDAAGALYRVTFGCVIQSKVNRNGTRQVAGFFLPGELFGWEIEDERLYSAECAGTTIIQTIEPAAAEQLPEWKQGRLVPSLGQLQEQLLILSRPTAEARVAAFLHNLLCRQSSRRRVFLPMHRFDIADYLGLSPETVSRVLRRFKQSALINTPNIHTVDILKIYDLVETYNK